MGVLIGEREGGNGVSVGMIGVVFVFCGRGINCAGLCLFWTGDFSVVFSPLMLRYGGCLCGFFWMFFLPLFSW